MSVRTHSGFTLVELVVVTAIIVVVSAVVLVNQNKFGGQVLLQNFAYDVALSIRQAQVYGLAVVRQGSGASYTFNTAYGMHFDISTPTEYYLFADLNNNGIYDGSTEDVPPSPYIINRGYSISSLCVNGASSCSARTVDIVFQRPEPDALISWSDGGSGSHLCLGTPSHCATSAKITLISPRGDTMSITVDNNGQIAVTKP